jgi:hypothetical protein
MQNQRVGMTSKLALVSALLALGAVSAQAQAQAPAPVDPAKLPPTAAGSSASDQFAKADASRDGKLSRDEARTVPGISDKFDMLDKDKDGSLNLGEFSAGLGK